MKIQNSLLLFLVLFQTVALQEMRQELSRLVQKITLNHLLVGGVITASIADNLLEKQRKKYYSTVAVHSFLYLHTALQVSKGVLACILLHNLYKQLNSK